MNIDQVINYGLKGIPKYPFGKPKSAMAGKYNSDEIVKINSNENSIGASPKAVEAAEQSLSSLNFYPDSTNLDLRKKFADKLTVEPENIFIGNGASEIIYYIAIAFLNDGDEVIVPEITYPLYHIAFKMMRANIVKSAMDGYKVDTEKIIASINKKTKLIAICNPNNPTGHTLKKDEMYRFIEKIPDDILLVVDEAYMDFADSRVFPDTISMIKNEVKNLYIIRTLSKAYGLAGLRVGYGIGPSEINTEMQKVKLPFNISLIAQHGASAALDDEAFLRNTVDTIKMGRAYIYDELKKMDLSYVESSTNFILIDVGRDSNYVTEELEKNGVMVRNAGPYGIKNCIRVTIGTNDQNKRFLRALNNVLNK